MIRFAVVTGIGRQPVDLCVLGGLRERRRQVAFCFLFTRRRIPARTQEQ